MAQIEVMADPASLTSRETAQIKVMADPESLKSMETRFLDERPQFYVEGRRKDHHCWKPMRFMSRRETNPLTMESTAPIAAECASL